MQVYLIYLRASIHTLIPTQGQFSLLKCFEDVGGNLRTQRKPTKAWKEHVKHEYESCNVAGVYVCLQLCVLK